MSSGDYECQAFNSEGYSTSNPVQLNIMCEYNQSTVEIMAHYYDESNLRACFAIKLNNRVSLELIGPQGILFFYLVTALNIFLHRYIFANNCA